MSSILNEDRRSELISRGKSGEREKCDGKTRFEKRVKSKVANTVREYNQINMNSVFKDGILTVIIPVVGETSNYKVKIKFSGFLDILRRETERLSKIDLRTIVRALLDSFNQDDVYISCSCLHPDTKIKLLDGTEPTVQEMCQRFEAGERLYCYSIDSQGDFIPGEVEKVWVTGQTTELIEITLDNGEKIQTTPDHLYMLRDGTYLPAAELQEGQSLMPLYKVTSICRIRLEVPVDVYDIKMKGEPNFLASAGVILHNCEDFFYRFSYWATVKNINSGEPQLIPAKITNPTNNKGPGCKHIMLVLSNTVWLLKVASVINNYIKYMERYRQNDYAKIIYPAIYGKKYTEPVQLSMDDSKDDILTDDETFINTTNEYGRTSGRFKRK